MLKYTEIKTGNIEGVKSDFIVWIFQPYESGIILLEDGTKLYAKETAEELILRYRRVRSE